MKAIVKISNGSYGFGHDWTLEVSTTTTTKNFYLGQDSKFCNRVLNMTPRYVIACIGTDRLDTDSGCKKLAKFICKELKINGHNFKKLQAWDLCCQ